MTDALGVVRIPDHVHFGPGSRRSLIPAVTSLGSRAFVVADPFLAGTPEFQELHRALEEAGVTVEVYTDVVPELPIDGVLAAADAARPGSPDVVVGYGGGSALDLAKLVALLLTHPGPLSAYYGENAVPSPVVPIIAVPTTAGTGSEVTPVAVVSDPDRELKVGISSPAIVPRYAIVDPELTVGAPAGVTAHSGVDAFVHAIESTTAAVRDPDWTKPLPVFVGRNALSSLLGREAIRAIGGSLVRAVTTPGDFEARSAMAWGSMLAGMAFGSGGTHLSHALQYPIGAMTKTPHGLGTGMMLPFVLQACLPTSVEVLAEIAADLGLPPGGSPEERAQAAIERVAGIVADIGLPSSLAEIGITRDQLPRIAELALGVKRLAGNSTQPASIELLERILDAAYAGDRNMLKLQISTEGTR